MKLSAEFWREWHCLALGFAEGMNPRKQPAIKYPRRVKAMIKGEYWYYRTGIGLAPVAWFGLFVAAIVIIAIIIKAVLL